MTTKKRPDGADINDLYKRAIRHAKCLHKSDLALDFAGFMAVRWLEGRSQHQTIEQGFIDFLRSEFGRSERQNSKFQLLSKTSPFPDEAMDEDTGGITLDGLLFKNNLHSTQPSLEALDWKRVLSVKERRLVEMLIDEDRPNYEIAERLGCSLRMLDFKLETIRSKIRDFRNRRESEWKNIRVVKALPSTTLHNAAPERTYIIKGPTPHTPTKPKMNAATRAMLDRYKQKWGDLK